MSKLDVGIDIGSTTVKAVVMSKNNKILYSDYRRHFSDTKMTVIYILNDIINKFKKDTFSIVTTGSGAIALSNYLGIPFVQEVIACKNAIKNNFY